MNAPARSEYTLNHSAEGLEEQRDLDAEMECYLATIRISVQLRKCSNGNFSRSDRLEQETYDLLPHWAAQPKQTPERVLATARELNKLTADLPPDLDAMKREYLRLRRAFSGGYATMIEAYRGGGEEVCAVAVDLALVAIALGADAGIALAERIDAAAACGAGRYPGGRRARRGHPATARRMDLRVRPISRGRDRRSILQNHQETRPRCVPSPVFAVDVLRRKP